MKHAVKQGQGQKTRNVRTRKEWGIEYQEVEEGEKRRKILTLPDQE